MGDCEAWIGHLRVKLPSDITGMLLAKPWEVVGGGERRVTTDTAYQLSQCPV